MRVDKELHSARGEDVRWKPAWDFNQSEEEEEGREKTQYYQKSMTYLEREGFNRGQISNRIRLTSFIA